MTARIGPPAQWRVSEIGDGNLNLVFIVEGAAGSVVVKQALPYARVVGESWPMSLDRSFFEQEALLRLGRRDPGRLPEIYYFDRHQAIQIMEHLRPHVILRKGLMAGERFSAHGRATRALSRSDAVPGVRLGDGNGAAEGGSRLVCRQCGAVRHHRGLVLHRSVS
ncbi:hypothetical protein ACFSKM_06770 [Ancylobacter dichloromethanicus]